MSEELRKHGEVRRSFLGLDVQPLLKGEGGPGALVSGVVPGSPAEKAGMRPGDILVALAGAPVDVRHPEELPDYNRRVMQAPVGAPLELTYLRDGREGHVAAVTVERGAAQGDEFELRGLGVTVRDLTLLSASERRREPRSGVLVTGLRQGGPAAEAKPALRPDDVVVSVAGRPVHSVRELALATSRASADKTGLLLGFDRQGQDLLTVVRPGAHDEGDRSAEARKAFLPVSAQALTPDLADALGLKGRTGVRVTQVYPGSSAEAAGLRKGDVLLQLDGQAIPVSRPEELETFLSMVRAYPLGSRVKLSAVRDGSPLSLTAELVLAPPPARELLEYRDTKFEFAVRDLTAQDRLQSMFEREQPGALVTRVEAGGWAALAHLAVGDVVLSVDGTRVDGAGALRERMERLAAGRPKRVVFFVLRGVQTLFLELEPAWPAAPAGPRFEEGEHR